MFGNKTSTGFTRTSLNDNVSDLWVAEGSEYKSATIFSNKPLYVYKNGVVMVEGTLGSLSADTWAWLDGTSRIYVRLSGDVDPDTLAAGSLKSLEAYPTLCTAHSDFATEGESSITDLQITNDSEDTIMGYYRLEDATGTLKHKIKFTCTVAEGTIQQSMKLHLNEGDILKFYVSAEDATLLAAGEGLL